MDRTQRSAVVGVFDHRAAAETAIADLRKAGFADDQIGIALRDASETVTATGDLHEADDPATSRAGTGALTGVLAGASLGTLAGFAVLSGAIPVIGPALAGGTLGILLSNAVAGASVAGLIGALVGSGYSEEEAHYYQGEFEAGRTLVTVHADARSGEASAILQRHGAYEMPGRNDLPTASSRVIKDDGLDLSGMGTTTVPAASAVGPTAVAGEPDHAGDVDLPIDSQEIRDRAAAHPGGDPGRDAGLRLPIRPDQIRDDASSRAR